MGLQIVIPPCKPHTSHLLWLITREHSPHCTIPRLSSRLSFHNYFLKDFIFRERGRDGQRRETSMWAEKHQLAASRTPPTRDLASKLGMCADWESNQWPFNPLSHTSQGFFNFFKILLIYFYRKGKGRGKRGHQCMKHWWVVSCLLSDQVPNPRNPGMCPDWGLRRPPFAL